MVNDAGGAAPLELAVFSLQDKLQAASLLDGRPAAIDALLAVAEFLSVISGPRELSHQRPINELISALISLDDGKVSPLLERWRRNGSPRNPIAMDHSKARIIWVVKRLHDAGWALDEVYEKVAAVCRQAGMRPGRMTPRTVRGWHEAASSDIHRHSRPGRQFDMINTPDPPPHAGVTPDELLARLRRFLASGPTNPVNPLS